MTWRFAATVNPHGPCRAPEGHWRTRPHFHVQWPHRYGHECCPTLDAATERLDELRGEFDKAIDAHAATGEIGLALKVVGIDDRNETTNKENPIMNPSITVDGVEYIPAVDILPLVDVNDPLAVLLGHPVFVRTVTMHYTGRLVAVTADTLVLDDAAWIADSGRFADALTTGTLSEVEPFPNRVYVARGALVDVTRWEHVLPREQR